MGEDSSLWAAAIAGDERAFDSLFMRHRDRVFRALLRSTTATHDAEDLTAVVFLELWRGRADARVVDGSLLPWLLVTANNVARNAARSRRRYARFLASLPAPDSSPDFSDSTATRMDAQRHSARVHAALESLSDVDRAVITLIAIEGFTLTETAAALGLSYNAAKTRLSRVRRKLRGSLPDLLPVEST